MKCGKCGYACNHVHHHRTDRKYAHIECNRRKTKQCDLLPIREAELKDIMESVVGKKDKLEQIVLFDDHIDFVLADTSVKTHIREYPQGGYYKTPFSRKIFCGCCGSSIVSCSNNDM